MQALKAIDPSSRISADVANELAMGQAATTGDADLGLKAGAAMPLGRAGPLDTVMTTAPTVGAAIDVGERFIRSFSDVLHVRRETDGHRGRMRFEMEKPMPRAVVDFTLSARFANHLRAPLHEATPPEVWLAHPRPPSTHAYEQAFAPASLRFDAPFCAFAFDRDHLEAPLATSDPALHSILAEHLAVSVAGLARVPTLISRVRGILMRELTNGECASTVARKMRMSPRTLGRRLESEGTNLSALLDHLRRELAVQYVGGHAIAPAEIAFRLGFAHVEAFHRAFKRWVGQTPLAFRRARDGCLSGDAGALVARGSLAPHAAKGDASGDLLVRMTTAPS